jgi:hypothetical protein
MRNPRPIIARLIRGPLAGRTIRIRPSQEELCYFYEKKTHVYRIEWPEKREGVLQVRAPYAGTRRR